MNSLRHILCLCATLLLFACAHPNTANMNQADMHNAKNALDWAATYEGTLPCASCSGIHTQLTLHRSGDYQMREVYLDHPETPFEGSGTFKWNQAGNTITLHADGRHYFVAENRLIALSIDGSRVEGRLADAYILKKTQ